MVAKAIQDSIPGFIQEINNLLSQVDCPVDVRRQIDSAADEVLSNIVDYAYPEQPGDIELVCAITAGHAELCISDSGTPFNPLDHTDPVLGVPSENGGLGIFLCKQLMDDVLYTYAAHQNKLTLIKNW